MKMPKKWVSRVAGLFAAGLIFLNVMPLIVFAQGQGSWSGNSWSGKPWEGETWEGSDWEGSDWKGEGRQGGGGHDGSSHQGGGAHEGSSHEGGGAHKGSSHAGSGGHDGDAHSGDDLDTSEAGSDEGGSRGDRYKDNVDKLDKLIGYRDKMRTAGQAILSYKYGFRLNRTNAGNVSISGLKSFENQPKTNYERNLMNEYKGDIKRNWYRPDQNQTVRKLTQPGYAVRQALGDNYNPLGRNFWKASNNLKGGGIIGLGLTTAGTFIDYSPIGSKAGTGYASTDFAASLTTDLGFAGATTAISTAAGAGATALALATMGSVVPGLGTAVGLVVGAGIGWFMGTEAGQRIRDGVQKTVKSVYDGIVNGAKKFGGWVKGLFGK